MNRPIDAASGFGMSPVPPADGPKDQRDQISPREHLTTLVEDMLVYRANPGVTNTFLRFPDLSPQDLLTRLRNETSLGLLIPDGEEMPRPMLDTTVRLADSTRVIGVALIAHRYREHRGVNRFLVLEFSSRYSDRIRAMQKIQLKSDSRKPGELHFHRVALVDPNSETGGYDRSPDVLATPEQAAAFIDKAKGLFNTWKVENPARVAAFSSSQPQAPRLE
mgnify:CR=1 FL=1